MRRGKISNANFIIIIVVAIFTLISYLADQLVIRNEDGLRNLNIKYNNKKTELRTNQSISYSILSIQMRASTIVDDYTSKRNIWIKSLLLTEVDNNYQNFFTNRKLNYKWDLKRNLKNDFNDIVSDVNSIREEFQDVILWLDIVNYKKITKNNSLLINFLELFLPNKTWEKNKNFLRDRDLYINLILKEKDEVESLMNNFSFKNWFDVYRLTMLSVENLYQDMNHLDAYVEYFDNLVLDNEKSLNDILKKQKKISLEKNSLILISILTQIIALLALLFLFRNFIKRKS